MDVVVLDLDAAQLARVRFAVSPLWEVGLAALVLRRPEPGPIFRRWVERTRAETDPTVLARVASLTAGTDFVPDMFAALSGDDHPDIESGLRHVRSLPDELVARDLDRLAASHRGGWVEGLRADLDHARREIAEVVEAFWASGLAPHWEAFGRLVRADVARRADAAAHGGQGAMLGDLHPGMSWTGAALDVVGGCETSFGPTPSRDGIVLVPSAFAWPHVHVMSNAPYQPAIAYAVRGFGTLWEQPAADGPRQAVERLLGAGRARVAASLTTPSTTTGLAHALGLAPATVSEHLRTLADAGFARSARDGRSVVYALTDLGREVLARG